jgi:hypothetical protein
VRRLGSVRVWLTIVRSLHYAHVGGFSVSSHEQSGFMRLRPYLSLQLQESRCPRQRNPGATVEWVDHISFVRIVAHLPCDGVIMCIEICLIGSHPAANNTAAATATKKVQTHLARLSLLASLSCSSHPNPRGLQVQQLQQRICLRSCHELWAVVHEAPPFSVEHCDALPPPSTRTSLRRPLCLHRLQVVARYPRRGVAGKSGDREALV